MTKKKVWMSFCIVMILLLNFTVLSLQIEKMMRIDVETVTVIIDEKTDTARLPKSCYQFDEFGSAIFYVEEKEGLLGKELVVNREEMLPISEEGESVILPSSSGRGESGNPLLIIREATWPVEKGDVVVQRKEKEVDVNRQIWILSCLVAVLLPEFFLLRRSVRKLGALQEGDIKAGIEGMILIGICRGIVFVCMEQLDIPRQYLPQDSILDIKFYMEELRRLDFFHVYRKELYISGICILGFWSVILFLKWFFSRFALKKTEKIL